VMFGAGITQKHNFNFLLNHVINIMFGTSQLQLLKIYILIDKMKKH
jgi:hypothetical protein